MCAVAGRTRHRFRRGSTSTADILPPPDTQRLEPGDFVEATIEHIVVPQFARDYYGPNENLSRALRHDENTWHMVHREATGNDLLVEATVGQVEQVRPTALRAAENRAEFAITGGKGYIPLTICGLRRFAHRGWKLVWPTGRGTPSINPRSATTSGKPTSMPHPRRGKSRSPFPRTRRTTVAERREFRFVIAPAAE